MQINMVDFKAINDADTDSQIAIFLQILAHCVMVFFQIIPCTMCIFLYKTPYNLGFVSEAKKIWKQCTYNVVYISGQSS